MTRGFVKKLKGNNNLKLKIHIYNLKPINKNSINSENNK